MDFFLCDPESFPNGLVIQCKWQARPGSVDEKYPFEVENIKADKYDTIIILDGGGYSEGAEAWLKNQTGKSKLRCVMSFAEMARTNGKIRNWP